ncbi:MAG: TIGR01777 family oxidoreductase [Actinomycetota bacterium]|nr:TIGR01777 family oxidoreductase [Actinomycetota bacterium]
MRVVVTGSSGLIGRAVVAALRARGDDVTLLVRHEPQGPSESQWEPAAGSIDPAAITGASAVVHLAGAGIADHRWSTQRKAEILGSRVRSTNLVARALAASAPGSVLVSGSAIGIYGNRGDEVLDERSETGHGFLADVCRAWEAAAEPAASAGARVVLLRTGVVLSPGGGALGRQLPLFRLGLGGRLGDGRQWLSWISLADEVGAILHAIDEPALSGPVDATAPNPVTNGTFTSALAAAVHRPALLAVPRAALRLALGPELADEALLASQRVLPARLVATGYRFVAPDITTALTTLLAA